MIRTLTVVLVLACALPALALQDLALQEPGPPRIPPRPDGGPVRAPADAAPPAGGTHQHGGHAAGEAQGHDATVRHGFADVDRWTKVFDDPGRDAWQKPEEVVAALGLRRGDVVADVGAGTGYFEPWLARAVGPEGAVLAVDVEPSLVEHLRARAEQEGTANVIPVLGSFDSPRLPPAHVDLVLLVDTYHHVDDRLGYFRRLQGALAPGGRVAVVDFIVGERPVGPPPEHALPPEHVIDEMRQAGYALESRPDVLPWQYVLVFGRVTP